ncbi:MAG: NADH:flavin oxidoreductase [Deltaproteobacteria bacterium]|jgi:2,4-dienoyl-CoA reductase-like NADH-dependent reductase (Old Yellow Enzyme family)|nr:NADH:flavin oxidoreductase [Deltaproteobacteria bacterium]
MNEPLERAFTSAKLGSLELKNRFLKAATFEGKTPAGVPGQSFLDFHLAPVHGGIAMTNFAYCAAEADGRIYDHMMYMHDGIRSTLSDMIRQIHEMGAKVCGQLTHCGGFSGNKKLNRLKRPQGPSAKLSMIGLTAGMPFVSAMNPTDIEYRKKTFGDASRFMLEVGFDAIEIHFGHGYALSQFLSPLTNRRSDAYGGSLGNRMRLPLEVLSAVQSATGAAIPLTGKLSLTDGVEGGINEAETIEFARQLDKAGIDAVIVSDGSSSHNPMKMFRGDSMLKGMLANERSFITRAGLRLVGPLMFKAYPYEDLYLLDGAKKVRDALDCQASYLGGCSTSDDVERVMSAGFDFIQLGRALIRDPNLVNNMKAAIDAGNRYSSECTHCNECATLINHPDGVSCPERWRHSN